MREKTSLDGIIDRRQCAQAFGPPDEGDETRAQQVPWRYLAGHSVEDLHPGAIITVDIGFGCGDGRIDELSLWRGGSVLHMDRMWILEFREDGTVTYQTAVDFAALLDEVVSTRDAISYAPVFSWNDAEVSYGIEVPMSGAPPMPLLEAVTLALELDADIETGVLALADSPRARQIIDDGVRQMRTLVPPDLYLELSAEARIQNREALTDLVQAGAPHLSGIFCSGIVRAFCRAEGQDRYHVKVYSMAASIAGVVTTKVPVRSAEIPGLMDAWGVPCDAFVWTGDPLDPLVWRTQAGG